jgi:cytochrome b561
MRPVSPNATHYDTTTIVLHWLTALLVAVQWLGAQTIDWFPSGAARVDARSVHITLGVSLAVVLAIRFAWRLTGALRLPPADTGALQVLAKAVHFALYGLLVAMVIVGVALAWTRGDSLFNLVRIPAFDPGNKLLAEQVGEVHAAIGWFIVAVAGAHAAAALFHRYVLKDAVLGRMLTRG